MSLLDHLFRRTLITTFFSRGWGTHNLERLFEFRLLLQNRERLSAAIPHNYDVVVDKVAKEGPGKVIQGHFTSPMTTLAPGVLPLESEIVQFELLVPDEWKSTRRPVCNVLSATGDHSFFFRHKLFGYPLLKDHSIATLLLKNPFYGSRKPPSQLRSGLLHVSDFFALGGALIVESLVMFRWLENQGYGPLGVSGVSLGGFNACLAATAWPKPLAIVPCLSGTTASTVFTQGALVHAIQWPRLRLEQDEHELIAGFQRIHDDYAKIRGMPYQMAVADEETFSGDGDVKNRMEFARPGLIAMRRNVEVMQTQYPKEFVLMKELFDQMTHLRFMERPLDSSATINILARHDEYIPRKGTDLLHEIWPNCETRYVDSGHIASVLFQRRFILQAIADAFNRL